MTFTTNEKQTAVRIYDRTILNCKKMQPKFAVGTSQATLLVNRIAALAVVRDLVTEAKPAPTQDAIIAAEAPIQSIIHKMLTAQQKHVATDQVYKRLTPMIAAMQLGASYLHSARTK